MYTCIPAVSCRYRHLQAPLSGCVRCCYSYYLLVITVIRSVLCQGVVTGITVGILVARCCNIYTHRHVLLPVLGSKLWALKEQRGVEILQIFLETHHVVEQPAWVHRVAQQPPWVHHIGTCRSYQTGWRRSRVILSRHVMLKRLSC